MISSAPFSFSPDRRSRFGFDSLDSFELLLIQGVLVWSFTLLFVVSSFSGFNCCSICKKLQFQILLFFHLWTLISTRSLKNGLNIWFEATWSCFLICIYTHFCFCAFQHYSAFLYHPLDISNGLNIRLRGCCREFRWRGSGSYLKLIACGVILLNLFNIVDI